MTTKPTSSDPFMPSVGGYRLDGSWDPHGHPTPLYELVRDLRRVRRSTNSTPADIAARIPDALAGAFPNLEQWLTLAETRTDMPAGAWSAAKTSTSVEASVVYAFTVNGQPMSYQPSHHHRAEPEHDDGY
jgi:hypothetical protein